MYYSLADSSQISINQLTAYFSDTLFIPGNNLYDTSAYFNHLPAQISHNSTFISDTANWTPLTGCFVAKGNEKFLTIGNFKDALHSPTTTASPYNNAACYIYIDDVSLYEMGYYGPPAICKNDTFVCKGASFVIGSNGKDSAQYSWSPAAGLSCTNCPNPIANPTITTTYQLTKQLCNYVTKDSITITLHTPTTTANAGADTTICLGDKIRIGTADSTDFTSYTWFPSSNLSCASCATPIASPSVTTVYTLQRQECSITSKDSIRIIIDDCNPSYFVPNVFTPNADSTNDTWGVIFSSVKHIHDFKLNIYDRWGLEVFGSDPDNSQPNIRWDGHTTAGEPCSTGVYFYIISFKRNDDSIELKGRFSLYR